MPISPRRNNTWWHFKGPYVIISPLTWFSFFQFPSDFRKFVLFIVWSCQVYLSFWMHRQQAKQNRNNKKLKAENKTKAVTNHTGVTCLTEYRYFFSTYDPWAEEMQQLQFLSIKEAKVTWPKNNTMMSRSSQHISPNYVSNLTTSAKMEHLYVEHNSCVLPGWTNAVVS